MPSEFEPESAETQSFAMDEGENSTLLRRPRLITRLSWKAEDMLDELNWTRAFLHMLATAYLFVILWIVYCLLPIHGHWSIESHSDKLPIVYQDFGNYFGAFQGYTECNIRADELYVPPDQSASSPVERHAYCGRREELLEAMSSGGRIGFDAPYFPRGCHYRWYSVEEICMILERFDAIVFVGDHSLQTVYNGFNILLRRDLIHGALKTGDMDKDTLHQCRCENQFTSETCAEHFVTSSEDITAGNNQMGQHGRGKANRGGGSGSNSPYMCSRTPHAFLRINNSPAPKSVQAQFQRLVPHVKQSNYHPVAIIHSLSPSFSSSVFTTAAETTTIATSSLLEFLSLADAARRKTPMLWLGPSAAGHTEVKGRRGNQEIWDFDERVAGVARGHDVDVLGMWNLTVQAASWDGVRFGEKVALTQAMMVVNWLARLPSS